MSAPTPGAAAHTGTTATGGHWLIRATVGDEVEALVALHDEVAAEPGLLITRPGERSVIEEELTLSLLVRQGGCSLTLEVDGGVAGRALVHRLAAGDAAEIGVILGAAFRSQGLGAALMRACIEWARASGLDRLELSVLPGNRQAIDLYSRLGFVDTGMIRNPRNRAQQLRTMALAL